MAKISKSTVVACEYIADGSNGKHTLVNVYSGDILVAEMPAQFPLAFFIELYFHEASGDTKLKVEIFIGSKRKFGVEAEIAVRPDMPGILVIPAMKLQFDEESEIRITAATDGGRATTLMRKTVSFGSIPT